MKAKPEVDFILKATEIYEGFWTGKSRVQVCLKKDNWGNWRVDLRSQDWRKGLVRGSFIRFQQIFTESLLKVSGTQRMKQGLSGTPRNFYNLTT